MKKITIKSNFFYPIVVGVLLFCSALQTYGQQVKPTDSGYAPVNGIKVYYEVYGEGEPIILLHGAFYTIEMN
jgi:hypothetical protein